MNSERKPSKRLLSLDALRGFTIAGMILVNVPGSWDHVYPLLRHAKFNGLTLADLVFPFFLFIVGASIVLALGKRLGKNVPKRKIVGKIVYRTVLIFIIGLFLNWMSAHFTFPLRVAGVLQRIALCYLAGSLLFLFASQTVQIVIGLVLLLGYWILTMFIPVPGHGVVFSPEMNWTAWVDGKLLPGAMYFETWDPEGILSTLPAIVTTLLGMWATLLVKKIEEHSKKSLALLIFGGGLLIAGLLLSSSFPVNKNVWSSSYVLVTAGLASMLWSFMIYLMDQKGWVRWAKPGIVFGANAITAYILHYLLYYPFGYINFGGSSLQNHFMDIFSGFLPQNLASLLWAVVYVVICYIPIWFMYRKKILIKI
jgi:predicted acyltransferase